jgi:CheY-like chemotaxis protein
MPQQEAQISTDEKNVMKTILLVEDDLDIGEVLVEIIKQETPYSALLVDDGFKAMNVVKEFQPHLLILDYQLPRMNGIELYDHLHAMEMLEHTPAIMMSALLPSRELAKRNIVGMSKPIDIDEFLQMIDDFLA